MPGKFLEQAFINTYGFDIHELFARTRPALRSYRTSVRSFIPAFAEAEVVLHRHQFPLDPDDEAHRIFNERVAQTNYQRHWAHTFRGPGIRAHLLAVLVFLIPKIGAASDLAIKVPNHDTEGWYIRSVNHTVDSFREMLDAMAANSGKLGALSNLDLDTGKHVKLGDYPLTDQTYAALLSRITSKRDQIIPEDLKQNIIEYYASVESSPHPDQKIITQLNVLKKMNTGDGLK